MKKHEVKELIAGMSLREKVAQLFIIVPEDTLPLSADFLQLLAVNPPGGFIYFARHMQDYNLALQLTVTLKAACSIAPFISVDEEGGTVSRLGSAKVPGFHPQPAAALLGATGNTNTAYHAAAHIGEALTEVGINMNYAPVADVFTEPLNTVIASRAYSSDPQVVSEMAAAFSKGLQDSGVIAVAKHFPGHGGTREDSHYETAILPASKEQLAQTELVPFMRLIAAGIPCIMMGHMQVPLVTAPENLPACLSPLIVTDILRRELGFTGVIVTDAMDMKAITNHYTAGEAAVLALQAGVDLLLMPEDYASALEGVLAAVATGALCEERLEQSLVRILNLKHAFLK